jgi:hypothetical protein
MYDGIISCDTSLNDETKKNIYNYLLSRDNTQIKGINISIKILCDSFDIIKSIGYLNYMSG